MPDRFVNFPETMSAALPDGTLARAKALAVPRGLTVSQWLRLIIIERLAADEKSAN